jgi:Uma2 family endonuclease
MEDAVKAAEILATEPLRLLRVEEYDRLVESGAFQDEHVELLEGVIVEMSPQGTKHQGVVIRLNRLFSKIIGDRATTVVQGSFAASPRSKPEPDLALVPPGDYLDAHPSKAYLIIEVADTSLRRDRVVKPALYARAGVPEYWVIDVNACTVLRMTRPRKGAYSRTEELGKADGVKLVAFPDVVVKLKDVLP